MAQQEFLYELFLVIIVWEEKSKYKDTIAQLSKLKFGYNFTA